MATEPKVTYEFGPFRLDPDKQVLLRENQPIAVTPKAFETLLILVRRSRDVVSKDELMKAIWPDSFVEEANLSQNIFVLRKALGDTPEDHRYIVTLPGRGYRFAAPVRMIRDEGDALVIAKRSRTQMVVEETEAEPAQKAKLLSGSAQSRTRWKSLLPAAAAIALMLFVALFLVRKRPPTALGEKDSVLVADFTNTTGDPVFDGTLRQGLEVQLEQSPFLSLIPEARIQHALQLMGRPADSRLSAEAAREVCERTGGAAFLEGSIASLGNQYVLGLRATNCKTGEVLDQEQAQASRKEDVLGALSKIASHFRERVGESLITVQKHDTPLEEATTSSLEALKAYSTGWQVRRAAGDSAALPFFKRATEIDPNFAMAHAVLGVMYGSTGESALATESIRRAYELRDRTSNRERFFITAYYDGRATGNQEKAQRTCEVWARTYPREMLPHAFLAGFIYRVLGKYEDMANESQKVIDLAPDDTLGYGHLGDAYVYLNRLPEAEEVLRKASERKLEDPFLLLLRFHLAFLKNDTQEMQAVERLAGGNSGAEDWITNQKSFVLANSGRLREARNVSRHASDLAMQSAHPERAALFETRAALWEAFLGNAPAAKTGASAALAMTRDREVEFGAGFALALAGDSSRAVMLADDLEKHFPEDTSVRFSYLPAIRGLLALRSGQPARAIALLQAATPYELGTPRSSIQGYFGALYPVYVRGETFLALRQGSEAAKEFQKILDHRGTVIGDAVGVLSQLGLARAYALSGDTSQARAKYQEFLALWKEADPDIPVLRQAKAEYARLQ